MPVVALSLALAAAAPVAPVALARVEWPAPTAGQPRLISIPSQIYLTPANAKEATVASVFFLTVDAPARMPVETRALRIEYLARGRPVRTDLWSAAMLAPGDLTSFPTARVYSPALADTRAFPHAYRLTLSAPAAMPFDAVRFTLEAKLAGRARSLAMTVPAARYVQ